MTSRVNPARHGTPPRLGALRVTAAAVVLFAGVTAALAAFSASVGRQMPLAALGLWPVNGDVYARAATGSIVAFVGKSGNATQALPANLPRQVGEFALKALALEPANTTAMRNLALYRDSHGDHDGARALMKASLAASRRETGVNLWLTQDLGRRGKEMEALSLYDVTVRTDTAAAAMLMTGMAQMLARPDLLPPLERLLATRPPWGNDFWTEVLTKGPNLENAFLLRRALHRRGVPMARDHDALLIEQLANGGLLEQAFSLHDIVGRRSDGDQLLENGSFDQASDNPPIGWKVVAESTFGSTIDREDGVLVVTALPEAKGVVAQQLVRLVGAGRFRFRADYSGADRRPLYAKLACADAGNAAKLEKSFAVPSGKDVDVALEGCRFAWASLVLQPDADPAGRDIRVTDVSLRRVN